MEELVRLVRLVLLMGETSAGTRLWWILLELLEVSVPSRMVEGWGVASRELLLACQLLLPAI